MSEFLNRVLGRLAGSGTVSPRLIDLLRQAHNEQEAYERLEELRIENLEKYNDVISKIGKLERLVSDLVTKWRQSRGTLKRLTGRRIRQEGARVRRFEKVCSSYLRNVEVIDELMSKIEQISAGRLKPTEDVIDKMIDDLEEVTESSMAAESVLREMEKIDINTEAEHEKSVEEIIEELGLNDSQKEQASAGGEIPGRAHQKNHTPEPEKEA